MENRSSFESSLRLQRYRYASAIILSLAAITTIALQIKPAGFVLIVCSLVFAWPAGKKFFREFAILAAATTVLGLTPINTDISYGHATTLLIIMTGLLIIPYLIFRYLYKDKAITYRFRGAPKWGRWHLGYYVFVIIVGYLFIPFYLTNSGAYLNWPAAPDLSSTIRLFIGTNYLGLWDELFFVCTVLTIYRRHFTFWAANIFTSAIFTSFLYDLGFRSYGPAFIIFFTLLQAYIYMRSKSLGFVVLIHLTFDLILFFALVHAHDASRFSFFITG